MNKIAPVALFVFNRVEHTRKTIEALSNNSLAKETQLYVFSDGPRNESDLISVKAVRDILRNVSGFKNVTVYERCENLGLAESIIQGVTTTIEEHGKIIVLEDDLVTNVNFLSFMNYALDFYEHEKKVWHISGWNYPIDSSGLGEAFFVRVMNCWGWATWCDRWKFFEKNTNKLLTLFTPEMINRFDLERSVNMWQQVVLNREKKIDTWAVFWYATIFLHGGLCLNPSISYVTNIGHDGSGTHKSNAMAIFGNFKRIDNGVENALERLPTKITENNLALLKIIDFYNEIKPSIIERFIRRLKKIFIEVLK